MLDQTLKILADKLNSYVSQVVELDEPIVQVASPVSPDGVVAVEASDRLLVFLANIHKDTLPFNGASTRTANVQMRTNAPLYLNLYVMVAANFSTARYRDALYFLSLAIECFLQNNVIDDSVVADMPANIDKLILDIENTSMGETSNLWGILGSKYLPSIMYKVRMVVMAPNKIEGRHIPTTVPERPRVV